MRWFSLFSSWKKVCFGHGGWSDTHGGKAERENRRWNLNWPDARQDYWVGRLKMCLVKLSSCVRKTESKQSWATHAISFFSPSRRIFSQEKKSMVGRLCEFFSIFRIQQHTKKILRLKIYKMRKANSLLRKENSHLSLVRSVEHCVLKCGWESYQLISEFSRQILLIIGVAGRLMWNRPKWMGNDLIEPKVRKS